MLLYLIVADRVQAICPVCTIVIGAGLGLSRWLKIDDTVSGIWIGALIVSSTGWFLNWLKKKQWSFKWDRFVVPMAFYCLILLPLYWMEIAGHPHNKFCGLDKLMFGIIVGSIIFVLGVLSHNLLKRRNNGKPFFPLQKVLVPVFFLSIASLILYLLTKC